MCAILSKLWIHLTNRKYTVLSFNYYRIFFQALSNLVSSWFLFVSRRSNSFLFFFLFSTLPFGYISYTLNVSFCVLFFLLSWFYPFFSAKLQVHYDSFSIFIPNIELQSLVILATSRFSTDAREKSYVSSSVRMCTAKIDSLNIGKQQRKMVKFIAQPLNCHVATQ